jgi:DNA-binding transcriptional MerR regulator
VENQGVYSIGQLASLSGLPIKTIRFYSDIGLLPPAGRTESGHRRYDATDLARLQLVRSLRDLGVDVPTVGHVLERKRDLGDILAAHIRTLETRIDALRRQLAVLKVAVRSPSEATVRRVQSLARLQAAERRRLLERFWDRVFEGMPVDPSVAERFRSGGIPDLPEEPTERQLDAWLELAELATDDDFVRSIRDASTWFWEHVVQPYDAAAWQRETQALADRAAQLVDAGIAPSASAADPLADELAQRYADAFGRQNTHAFRTWLSSHLESTSDPRAARYWQLVAEVSGVPHDPAHLRTAAAYTWLFNALHART